MLIELIEDKRLISLEIGCKYLTKPDSVGLSPNKVIQIKDINNKGGYVVYIYTIGSPGGNFTRSKKEVERCVILKDNYGGEIR